MRKVRLLIQVTEQTKAQLDAMRKTGTTASGFIRALVEREFSHQQPAAKRGQKGR